MERRMVRVYVCDAEAYTGEWPPSKLMEFVSWLNGRVSMVPEQYRDRADIYIQSVSGYGDDHYANIEISYLRLETDEEYQARLADVARSADQKRAAELEMLHNLKAKYESGV